MTHTFDVRIAPNGRMVLPRAAREALGVSGAAVVVVSVEVDAVTLTSARRGVERARALYRAHATADASSDAFLEQRRHEAGRDRLAEEAV